MTSSSSSLIDDICSELLVCRICLESLRHAKTLSCRHAFCEVCLEKLQDSSELSDDDDDDDDGVRLLTTSRRTSFISRRNTHSAAAAGQSSIHLTTYTMTVVVCVCFSSQFRVYYASVEVCSKRQK